MSRSVEIAIEFLHEGEAPQKKNALTALSVIATSAALRELTESALGAEDEVSTHAQQALESLRHDREKVVGLLTGKLDVDDTAQAAYVLLGKLRSRGFPAPSGGPSRTRLLKLAWGVFSSTFGGFKRRWYRGILPGAIGGTLGALALIGYLTVRLDSLVFGSLGAALFFWGLLAVPLLTLAGSIQLTPISRYVGLRLGLFVEAARSLLWVGVFSLPPIFVVGFFGTFQGDAAFALCLIVGFGLLTVPVVRVATALSVGVAQPGPRSVVLGTAAGALAGVLFQTGIAFGALRIADLAGVARRPLMEYSATVWALSIPACIGLGLAFAWIESQDGLDRAGAVLRKGQSAMIQALVALGVIAIFYVGLRSPDPVPSPVISDLFQALTGIR